jgi:hypothetical protein
MKMQKVYYLHHTRDKGTADEDDKEIGTYTSYQLAKEAINRLKDKTGFIEYPNDFYIDEYIIDKDYWTDGFSYEKDLK